MAENVILAEQTIEGFAAGSDGLYGVNISGLFVLIADVEYRVVWDGKEHTCTSYESDAPGTPTVMIGNKDAVTGTNSELTEPFTIVYAPSYALNAFSAADGSTETSHTVAIYQVVAEEVGILLKDHTGTQTEYTGIETVTFDTTDGGTQVFSKGQAVEGMEIALDFSGGDMAVNAEDGILVKSAVIKKPDTLVAENIVKDVEIAGVVGTSEGGGSLDIGSDKYIVQVIDYDGTVLALKYLDAGEVFALPDAPTHERLAFEGWSSPVTITDGTVTVLDSDITIGAVYHTVSGATEIDISLTKATGLTFTFRDVLTGMSSINWGDGVTDNSLTHTYSSYGEYTIKIYDMYTIDYGTSSNGGIVAATSSAYNFTIVNVFLSNSIIYIRDYAFQQCRSLTNLVIPNSVAEIGSYAFNSCGSLVNVIISPGTTIVSTYAFNSCYSLRAVVIPKNNSIVLNDYAFRYCYSLQSIVIPDSATYIGTYLFYQCFGLKRVFSFGKTINAYTFGYCYGIESVYIQNAQNMGGNAFGNARTLRSIKMPKSVTSIYPSAFNSCVNMLEYDFSQHTGVPELGADAFSCINGQCKILVPSALYDEWIAATNWSTYANYIVAV